MPEKTKKQNTFAKPNCCFHINFIDFFPLRKTEQQPKGEVKNHNHTASKMVILRKANLHCLEFVLLPLFLILHLAHFDFQARKLGHYRLAVKRQTKERRENRDGRR